MDSSGIKMMGEGEWRVKKHDADYCRQSRKLYLGIDAQTQEIRAMEVIGNCTGDATMQAELLMQRLRIVVLRPAYLRVETASSGKGIHDAIRRAMRRYAR